MLMVIWIIVDWCPGKYLLTWVLKCIKPFEALLSEREEERRKRLWAHWLPNTTRRDVSQPIRSGGSVEFLCLSLYILGLHVYRIALTTVFNVRRTCSPGVHRADCIRWNVRFQLQTLDTISLSFYLDAMEAVKQGSTVVACGVRA